jgi:Golgi phosphoprotein 3
MTTITRRKPASTNSGAAYTDSASNNLSQSNQNDRDDRDRDDDRDNDDDKETRLTLMEEVLLLGLKDREVCFELFFH